MKVMNEIVRKAATAIKALPLLAVAGALVVASAPAAAERGELSETGVGSSKSSACTAAQTSILEQALEADKEVAYMGNCVCEKEAVFADVREQSANEHLMLASEHCADLDVSLCESERTSCRVGCTGMSTGPDPDCVSECNHTFRLCMFRAGCGKNW